jgi:glycine oxidase
MTTTAGATLAAGGRPPVLVLGAGLMGRLLGVALAREGHPVRMVDAGTSDGSGGAARVAAAMLAPLAESAITEPPVVAMGRYALQRWPELLAALPAPVFFQREGTLVLWHRHDAAESRRFEARLAATCRALPDLPAPQVLDADAVGRLEPALAGRFAHGLYLPLEGQLDNRALLHALGAELQRLGVAVEWQRTCTLEQAVRGQGGGWVLDCRGLGARAEWRGASGTLRGVRGEVVRLHAPAIGLRRPVRLLHPRYPIYIAPKPGDVYVVGATEIEADDLSPASVRSVLELLSAAYAVHPAFGEARIVELAAQCRPTLDDNLPAVHEVSPRVLQINGLYRHGFMVAPALLDAVLEWMRDGRCTLARRLGLRFDTAQPVAA